MFLFVFWSSLVITCLVWVLLLTSLWAILGVYRKYIQYNWLYQIICDYILIIFITAKFLAINRTEKNVLSKYCGGKNWSKTTAKVLVIDIIANVFIINKITKCTRIDTAAKFINKYCCNSYNISYIWKIQIVIIMLPQTSHVGFE